MPSRPTVVPARALAFACGEKIEEIQTDHEGRFRFQPRAAWEDCVLTVSHPGFASFRQSVGEPAEPWRVRLGLGVVEEVRVVPGEGAGLSFERTSLTSVSLSASELERISNDTEELVRYVTNASVPVSSASGDLSLPDGFDGVYAVEPEAPEREQGPTTPAISGPGQGAGPEDDSEGGSNAAWYIIGGVAAVVPFVFNPTTGSTTGSTSGCDQGRPPLPSSCVGISRNSSSCNDILKQWDKYCRCNGFDRGFNVSIGSCY